MQLLWCWRCKMEVPMLNEDEYAKAHLLYGEGMKNNEVALSNRQVRFKKVLDYYFRVTGFVETEPNAVMHHRISLYGPPCENCKKPYRTPQATFCASCGRRREQQQIK